MRSPPLVASASVLMTCCSVAWCAGAARTETVCDTDMDQVRVFVDQAASRLEPLTLAHERTSFLNGVDETEDHTALLEHLSLELKREQAKVAAAAERLQCGSLPGEARRQLRLIAAPPVLPNPMDPTQSAELEQIVSQITSAYTSAANCTGRAPCRTKDDLYKVMRESREPDQLLAAWREWHDVGRAIRKPYARMVELANAGASIYGSPDVGALWRSQYEMSSADFQQEYERLWNQVRPLYGALHCHVRAKLREHYGSLVALDRPIPAHLLGNMWAQYWSDIEPLVAPGDGPAAPGLTERLQEGGYTPERMARAAERFFVSLRFQPLPVDFWHRSLLAKPDNRKANCHASAWSIDPRTADVRVKMCVDIDEADFRVLHHELGHIYYYLSYAAQPFVFRTGANPGFHEAVGDALALSMTPAYLRSVGLGGTALPSKDQDLKHLLHVALDKVPAMAMAIVVDKWRWGVFSGNIAADRYNDGWWRLSQQYQGIAPPLARDEQDFDAGMFYHISYNVPYDSYFIASILQFDFFKGLCATAGHRGPLHTCSIYGSAAAGDRLRSALQLGASRPWPDALHQLTGHRQLDASALLDYFAPLMAWLERENAGRQCER